MTTLEIVRSNDDRRPVMVGREPLLDTGLSIEACGWLCWLKGQTAFTMEDVYERSTKGRDKTDARLKELEDAGYLYREQKSVGPDGAIGWKYHTFDSPDDNPHFTPEG